MKKLRKNHTEIMIKITRLTDIITTKIIVMIITTITIIRIGSDRITTIVKMGIILTKILIKIRTSKKVVGREVMIHL